MNKRYVLSHISDQILFFDILAYIRKYILKKQQKLIALTYHRIYNINKNNFPFAEEVISATPEQFDKQLSFIKQYFTVVTPKDLYQYYINHKPFPSNALMITFDDGYKDNYYNAFKLLKKHDLKATFFISTEYIEKRKLFWWDEIYYIIKTSNKDKITLQYPRECEFEINSLSDKLKTIGKLLQIAKDAYNLDFDTYINKLAEQAGVKIDASQIADHILLTWDEIKEMGKAGMEIGSHTMTHRILTNLPDEEITKEIHDSKRFLEQKLGEPVLSISYPVGRFNTAIQKKVIEIGYKYVFTPNDKTSSEARELNVIKRIGVEIDFPHSYFKSIVTMPSLFCYR